MSFRVIVAGGRDFNNYPLLESELDYLLSNKKDVTIVSGMAKGADTLGELYGARRGLSISGFGAEWDKYGKSAGYIRNREMARNANALVAFWDGKSRGTKHMIDLAYEHGLAVRVINY